MFPDPPSATPRLRDLDTATMRVTTKFEIRVLGWAAWISAPSEKGGIYPWTPSHQKLTLIWIFPKLNNLAPATLEN